MKILAILLLMAGMAAGAPAYPLHVVNGRYLADSLNVPFHMVGDAPQLIFVQISTNSADTVLADRQTRGINSLWIYPIDKVDQTNAPNNFYGQPPFTGADFVSENLAYWTNVDWIMQDCASRGLYCVVDPCFVGLDTNSGYIGTITNTSDAVLGTYATWISSRYAGYSNIMWSLGGDADPNVPNLYKKLNVIATAIRSNAPNQLITLEASRFLSSGGSAAPGGGYSSMDAFQVAFGTNKPYWLDVNWVYNTQPTAAVGAWTNYTRAGAIPAIMGEDWYEHSINSGNATPDWAIRQESWWEELGGCNEGRLFGNTNIWQFVNWTAQLNTPGIQCEQYIANVMTNNEWQNLYPDTNHIALTSGYGTIGLTNWVASSRAPDGHLAISYFSTNNTATANFGTMTCVTRARWYDPTTGLYTTAGSSPYKPWVTDTFTPSTNASNGPDQVLVFDPQPNTTAVIATSGIAVNLTVK